MKNVKVKVLMNGKHVRTYFMGYDRIPVGVKGREGLIAYAIAECQRQYGRFFPGAEFIYNRS